MTHAEFARRQAHIAARISRWAADTLDRARWDDKPADFDAVKKFTTEIAEELAFLCYCAGMDVQKERAAAKAKEQEKPDAK